MANPKQFGGAKPKTPQYAGGQVAEGYEKRFSIF